MMVKKSSRAKLLARYRKQNSRKGKRPVYKVGGKCVKYVKKRAVGKKKSYRYAVRTKCPATKPSKAPKRKYTKRRKSAKRKAPKRTSKMTKCVKKAKALCGCK